MNAIARKLPTVARLFLGLVFLVFGLNGFLQFLPQPPLPPGPAADLLGGFASAGYMVPVIKGTEVLVGLALLSNRFVPLALVVLAPITVQIVLFHAFLAPAGLALPAVVLIAHLGLAWAYRAVWPPVLAARVAPEAPPASGRALQPAAAGA